VGVGGWGLGVGVWEFGVLGVGRSRVWGLELEDSGGGVGGSSLWYRCGVGGIEDSSVE